MKTLVALLVLAVILLSSCRDSKKELRGYIEEGAPNPTLIWHVSDDSSHCDYTYKIKVVAENGVSTIVEVSPLADRFPGRNLVVYKGTCPLAQGKKVFISGNFIDGGLFFIYEARLYKTW